MAMRQKRTSTGSYVWNNSGGDDLELGQLGINTTDGTIHLQTGATSYVNFYPSNQAVVELADLTDVVSAANTNGFALVANGTTGYIGRALLEADISDLGSYSEALPELSDVTITGSGANELLFTTGANTWVNYTLAEADIVGRSDADVSAYTWVLDQDDMSSNSNTKVPTQQSVKAYVDASIEGFNVKAAVRVATAVALPAYTQAGAGVNATITMDAVGVVTIDGEDITAANSFAVNDRILVQADGSATAADEGIYEVTILSAAGVALVLTRTTDADTTAKLTSAYVFVNEGTAYADTSWLQIADVTTVDTTAQDWSQFISAAEHTITNVGAGADVWRDRIGNVDNLRGLNAINSKITIAVNSDNIDFTINEASIDHDSLLNFAANEHFTQAAISITESQISDLQSYLLAEVNDLTAAVTWANVPDANITESSVTQHETALTITESQISDLAHLDTNAIHDNIAGEISAIASKTILDGSEKFIIEDGADSNNKKSVGLNDLPHPVTSRTIYLQTEVDYDDTGFTTDNGNFFGGINYAVLDTINMQDGTFIIVDTVSSGVVTEFTINSPSTKHAARFKTLYQSITSGSGSTFTLTPDTNNLEVVMFNLIDDEMPVLGGDLNMLGNSLLDGKLGEHLDVNNFNIQNNNDGRIKLGNGSLSARSVFFELAGTQPGNIGQRSYGINENVTIEWSVDADSTNRHRGRNSSLTHQLKGFESPSTNLFHNPIGNNLAMIIRNDAAGAPVINFATSLIGGAEYYDDVVITNSSSIIGYLYDETGTITNHIAFEAVFDSLATNNWVLKSTEATADIEIAGQLITGALTYPNTDSTADFILKTDGAGVVGFVDPAGSDTDAVHTNVDGEINAITAKTTKVDADIILIEDSASTFAKKKMTIADLLDDGTF